MYPEGDAPPIMRVHHIQPFLAGNVFVFKEQHVPIHPIIRSLSKYRLRHDARISEPNAEGCGCASPHSERNSASIASGNQDESKNPRRNIFEKTLKHRGMSARDRDGHGADVRGRAPSRGRVPGRGGRASRGMRASRTDLWSISIPGHCCPVTR